MPWLSLIIFLLVLPLIPTAYAGWIGAPYAPTRIAVVKKAFAQLGLGSDDTLVDLGCGDGKILLAAAQQGSAAIGYELSPILWVLARYRTWGNARVQLRYRNFFKAQLPADTTHVFAFLMPDNMPKVRQLLSRQRLSQGKFFFAYAFPLKDIPPLRIIQAPNCAALYVYNLQELTEQA